MDGTRFNATPEESVTVNPKVLEPAPEGVPLTRPLDDSDSPAGSDPDESFHVYGGTPPDNPVSVNREALYEIPTFPFGSVTGVLSVKGDGVQVTVMVKDPKVLVMAAVSVPVRASVVVL